MQTNITSFVALILPVYNESAYIRKGLLAILNQNYSLNCMEILIADGISTDDTRNIVKDFSAQHARLQIYILDNPSKIVPTGMNIALQKAKGEVIIRIDGHTLIAPDYVRQCVETLQHTHADNVGGKMNAIGSNPFGQAVAIATSAPFGIGNARFHYSNKEEWVDTVYMGAWHRQVFEKIGLFDEELIRNQDDEFNYRLRSAGGKILLSPKIKSEYTVRDSPAALWKQYYQYGYWKVRVLQKHPLQMSLRQFVPPTFVLVLFISILLAFFPPFRSLSSVISALYLLANLSASLYTASKQGWTYLPLLPLVFAILHLSYGLGFLAGLFHFWNRWCDKTGKTPVWSNENNG